MNAGGLGACGALLMQPDEIAAWADEVRAKGNGPYQLNLWIPDPPPVRDTQHEWTKTSAGLEDVFISLMETAKDNFS